MLIEVFTDVLVIGLVVMTESHLVFMMGIIQFLLMTSLMVQMMLKYVIYLSDE